MPEDVLGCRKLTSYYQFDSTPFQYHPNSPHIREFFVLYQIRPFLK